MRFVTFLVFYSLSVRLYKVLILSFVLFVKLVFHADVSSFSLFLFYKTTTII